MFNNYIRDPRSQTPLNLGFARILLSVYLCWKVVSVPWGRLDKYPVLFPRAEPLVIESLVSYLELLQWLVVLLLVPFALGAYLKAVAFVLSVLVSYLGVNLITVNTSGLTHSFFLASILLLLYAVYAEQDKFSVDGIRRRSSGGIESLNRHLVTPLTPRYRQTPLAVFLLGFSFVYFGSGVAKVLHGGTAWLSPVSLGRYIHPPGGFFPTASEMLLQNEIALFVGALGTFVLELGFVVAVVTGVLFTPFVLSLIAFHASIAAVMGPIFLDFVVFLLLFANWEGLVSRLQSNDRVDLIYDDRCVFCAQSLYPFKFLDVNQSVYFHPASDFPTEYDGRQDIDDESTMYFVRDDQIYEGYDAFRALFSHLGVLRPVAFLMTLPLISTAGARVYGYVAENRTRHFTSPVDD